MIKPKPDPAVSLWYQCSSPFIFFFSNSTLNIISDVIPILSFDLKNFSHLIVVTSICQSMSRLLRRYRFFPSTWHWKVANTKNHSFDWFACSEEKKWFHFNQMSRSKSNWHKEIWKVFFYFVFSVLFSHHAVRLVENMIWLDQSHIGFTWLNGNSSSCNKVALRRNSSNHLTDWLAWLQTGR